MNSPKKLAVALSCMVAFNVESQSTRPVVPAEKIINPKLERISIKPFKSLKLERQLTEGSGLIAWNGFLWLHNDSGGDPKLFVIDTTTGAVTGEYAVPKTENRDWEDICDDNNYIYIGDIGNNGGLKELLHIFRIDKQSLLNKNPVIDTISFSWPVTRTGSKIEKINFDCEAMIATGDSIFLFTKEWRKGRRTRMFSLPKKPGAYVANYRQTLKTRVLVTGASYHAAQNKLVLCGYNLWLKPFLLSFTECIGTDFFKGKVTKVKIRKPLRQVEGITTFDGKEYYLVNEKYKLGPVKSNQQLHKVNLTPLTKR